MSKTKEQLFEIQYRWKPYAEGLDHQERPRFLEKLHFIGGADLLVFHLLLILKWLAACYFSLRPNTMKDLKSWKFRETIIRCEWIGEGDEVSSHDRCVVKFYVSMQVL